MSFLAIEGLHAFVTGAAGGIGSAIVKELLANGANVTAHDIRPSTLPASPNLRTAQSDIASEAAIAESFKEAFASSFGPVNILVANAGITDESVSYPVWQLPTELWDRVYNVNVRGTFFTVKGFLSQVEAHQKQSDSLLPNLAVVITGSECGKFGQAGHAEYASGKAALQYGFVRTLKNEIVRLNPKARVNAVAPGWVDTGLIGDRLADPHEMWAETQATLALRKIAQPEDVARTVAYLASERVSGHVSGECVSVDGGMEGRVVWREDQASAVQVSSPSTAIRTVPPPSSLSMPPAGPVASARRNKVKLLISVDFDAVSAFLGTGINPENNWSDYSSGVFSARVGVPRLLRVFKRLGLSRDISWFLPGHSIESFPDRARAIVESGGEIGLHGYSHEGASQMTAQQERDVLERCIDIATKLTGKRPRGYRAPLYQLAESTAALLQEKGFLYDSSLTHHDSRMYRLPANPVPRVKTPVFKPETRAAEWMVPLPRATHAPDPARKSVVEIPGNWYGEDETPLKYFPHLPNTQGYVPAGGVEDMWRARLEWVLREAQDVDGDEEERGPHVFPLILHPDTSGMAHVVGMVEHFLVWCRTLERQGLVEFSGMAAAAEAFAAAGG